MTIKKAEQILDIVSAALQDDTHPLGQHPISALRGHDLFSIITALKLRIANEFLLLAARHDFEERFADGLRLYDSIPWQIMRSFVADDDLGKVGAKFVLSPIDPVTKKFTDSRLSDLETGSSFGDFCRSVGCNDPAYWRKIYARIGLEYTAESPKQNIPVAGS